MTDQIKPASDSRVELLRRLTQGPPPMPRDGEILELIARIDELKAQLAAQEQSHKAMLQTAGEEATRQIAELQIQPSTGSERVWVGGDHRCRYYVALTQVSYEESLEEKIAEKDKRIAELEKAVDVLGWQCDKHRGRIAELEADAGGDK